MVNSTNGCPYQMHTSYIADCRIGEFRQSLLCTKASDMVSTNPKNGWPQYGTTGNGSINMYLVNRKKKCLWSEQLKTYCMAQEKQAHCIHDSDSLHFLLHPCES